MNSQYLDRIVLLTCLAVFMTVVGCGTTEPSRFYLLNPAEFPSGTGEGITKDCSVVIGPVEIPKYLDRSQIVTRFNLNEIHLAEFDRWAEPLGQNITRVILENLSIELSTDQVFLYPYRDSKPVKYRVAVTFVRFDADDQGCLGLLARWKIHNEITEEILVNRKSDITRVGVDTSDYVDIVCAGSLLLEELCQEIAGVIIDLEKAGQPKSAE